MTDTLKNEFWDRIEKAGPGMLSAGDAQAVPMTHQSGRDEGALWFITARDTALATAAKGGAQSQYLVASDSANLYARIDGALRTVTDKAKLDELWSAFAAAWFEDGKHDPDVQLIRFEPARAEVWASDGTASFLYEVARANVDGSKITDAGQHGHVTF